MHRPDLSSEIVYRTARSGGKGGQNVNKVETRAEAMWPMRHSRLFSEEEKARLAEKLGSKINKEGFLCVRASESRTQIENKIRAQQKLETLVAKALTRPKPRKPSKPSRASIEARLDSKKRSAFKKQMRKKDFEA